MDEAINNWSLIMCGMHGEEPEVVPEFEIFIAAWELHEAFINRGEQ